MKNQLADIPDQIVQLEVLHDEGGFSSVQELRDKYRDVHLRKALSGQLQTDNPDARKLPQLRHPVIQGAGKGLPDYPSSETLVFCITLHLTNEQFQAISGRSYCFL